MPTDLKIVSVLSSGALTGATWPDPVAVSGEYNLVQRIYKNLICNPGDDDFDTEWGSGLQAKIQGIAGQQVERAKQAVMEALRKCEDDIKDSFSASTDPAERLNRLSLESLEYDFNLAAWRVEVFAETDANTVVPITVTV
jgi:hypothetical protein